MPYLFHRLAAYTVAALLFINLAGCSSGVSESGTSQTSANTATVGILLTDKPADPSLFTSINATIDQVELLGADEEVDKVVLYSGLSRTVDLLSLKNESIPFTFKEGVPAGTYCKIRLILHQLELVLTDGSKEYPKLPGNGKLDLVFGECLGIGPGETVTLQMDVDAGNSIHIVEAGNSGNSFFNFRPVIHIDVIGDGGFETRLTRISGEIIEVDAANGQFTLCGLPTFGSSTNQCADVVTGDDSAYFDNVVFNGAPRSLSELLDAVMIGKTVTVVGLPQHIASAHTEENEEGNRVVLLLDALVIESGTFLTIDGRVAADADEFGFDMDEIRGPVQSVGPLPVVLQAGTIDYNGTRILSKHGTVLDYSAILQPREVSVDGVLAISSADELNAALVIVDTASDDDQVTGTVLMVNSDSFELAPDAADTCGYAGDLVVSTVGAEVMTVTITTSGSEITEGGTLLAGQSVGLVGSCTMSGYSAGTIVIIDDQRP